MNLDFFDGDSIPRGFNLGTFFDALSGAEALYKFGSIQSILNMMCEENDVDRRFVNINAYPVAPQSGDVVHVSDAGPTTGDPDEYEEVMKRRYKKWADQGFSVYAWTTFDGTFSGGPTLTIPLYARFSHTFGTRTMNDAIRSAADQDGVTLIDIEDSLQSLATVPWGGHLLKLIQPDDVHYNVLGAFGVAGAIYAARGLRDETTVNSILSLVAANWQTIYGTSQYWPSSGSSQIAQDYATAALLPSI